MLNQKIKIMAVGTIQDSRKPNSPQWGYLKVKRPHELNEPKQLIGDWNEYVIFVTAGDRTPDEVVASYKEDVQFEMRDAEISGIEGLSIKSPLRIQIAVIEVQESK